MVPRKQTESTALAALALMLVTAVWGSTFFLIKDLLAQISAADFLAARFTLAAVVGAVVFHRQLRAASLPVWRRGVTLGAIYFLAQLLQTVGLHTTDASVSGFITGIYVVLTPIIVALFFRERLSGRIWLASAITTVGLMVLSLRGLSVGGGEGITFLSAVLYALHIALMGRWARGANPFAFAVIQMMVIAASSTVFALPGGIALPRTTGAWVALVYMALVAGLGAMVAQSWAQGLLHPATAAIIMVTEPVFAAFFAVVFGGEFVTGRLLVGGSLIFVAMLLTEVGGAIFKRRGRVGPPRDEPALVDEAPAGKPPSPTPALLPTGPGE